MDFLKLTRHRSKDVDGGYAWIILLAVFFCMGISLGMKPVYGILYLEILERYQAGQMRTSWVVTSQLIQFGLMGKLVVMGQFAVKAYMVLNYLSEMLVSEACG